MAGQHSLNKTRPGEANWAKENVRQHMHALKTRGVQGHAPRENVDILGP